MGGISKKGKSTLRRDRSALKSKTENSDKKIFECQAYRKVLSSLVNQKKLENFLNIVSKYVYLSDKVVLKYQ